LRNRAKLLRRTSTGLAVGIDLGTTNSLVATVRSGWPWSSAMHSGVPCCPRWSALPAVDGHSEVGYEAQAKQAIDPRNTIVSVKRFMGRGLHDIAHIESYALRCSMTRPGMLRCTLSPGVKSPVEVSADILRTCCA
jgi:molecular chaperone HscA